MTRKEINVFDCAGDIVRSIGQGILLTAKAGDTVNTMTIGWGHLGFVWQKPVFIAYVREGRFTRPLIDEAKEFTISIPHGTMQKKITAFCGTKSGRTTNKIQELGLTLLDGECVSSPAIAELPLTLECKVICRQKVDKNALPAEIQSAMYPADIDSTATGCNRDEHVAYYGEIVRAYIIEK